LVKYNSISEVSQKIASDVNETLSKQQKEFYLRQQLAAIQRELAQLQGSGEDHRLLPGSNSSKPMSELDNDSQQDQEELDDMRRKIEALEKDSEERKVCVREWKRMKRAQPSSVEQGVIRSYVSTDLDISEIMVTYTRAVGMDRRSTLAEHYKYDSVRRFAYGPTLLKQDEAAAGR
jgi:ATP-dependent Lon protease